MPLFNQISKSRLELARRNANRFISNLNVKAILVTGSVALGYADDNSDIDTLILHENKLTDSEVNDLIENAKSSGGDLYGKDSNGGLAVYEYIEGVRCDFGHGYIGDTEKLITDMVNNPVGDMVKQLLVSGFLDSVTLYGEQWVNTWKRVASHYPEELTLIMLKEHLRFHPKWVLEKMIIDRCDMIYLYEVLVNSVRDVICVLCGLNKIYYNGKLKSSFYFIEKMKMKPLNLQGRFEKILKDGNSSSVDELYKIIEEVFVIIETNRNDFDTSRARDVIKMVLRK